MGKTLVAFFSASGVTARVAERLAKVAQADLFEISPKELYTEADLNWNNKDSRSTVEMKNPDCRPEIWSEVSDMSIYDTVYVGFPIWWYREPSIIDTFIESYDFSGKKIIPFATSGGSGLGDAPDNISKLAPGATVLPGKRMFPDESEKDMKKWIEEM
ncbi:MAG: NAD(P)H-dependent oxidoreductase [Lachnospiraceae bacterium]|nr:NAD(P)H-dependent oxidoreductase [Lachnospiraceae bacterium]